ncbi:MAG: hypothetical protein AMXMBFR53_20040 [Gemmatimonadota bacterium]
MRGDAPGGAAAAVGPGGREAWALAALAAVGVALHLWYALGADALDTDRALVLLMARDFAAGRPTLYFWQQNYMAALEPLVLAPLAWTGWATPVAAGVVGVALTALLALVSVGLAARLGAPRWVALLFWALPPAVVAHHHVALYGARLAATLLALTAFAWGLRRPSPRGWVGVGVLVGVAYFADHLMLPWALGVMWVAVAAGGLGRLAAGALPVVAADTVAAVLTPAAHLSGPNDPGSWLGNVPLLFGRTLPQLFGVLPGGGPGPLFEAPAPLVPEGWAWVLFAVPGGVALGAMAVTLWRRRAGVFGGGEGDVAAQALLVACAAALGLFAVVGGGGDRWPVRYLVPLWPAVSVLAALAVGSWRAGLRPLALAAVLPALHTQVTDGTWPRGGDGAPARAEAEAVARAVAGTGAEAVWADYWDAYRLALLAGDDPPWLPMRIIERRPALLEEALGAGPVAYLVRAGDGEVLDLLARAPDEGIAVLGDEPVGRFRLVVTAAAVPGATLRSPPPPRWWQGLAALAAGMLFVGAMAGTAVLARLRDRRPSSPTACGGAS